MPKVALSEVAKGGVGFLKGFKCFVGSENVLTAKDISVLEKNVGILGQ